MNKYISNLMTSCRAGSQKQDELTTLFGRCLVYVYTDTYDMQMSIPTTPPISTYYLYNFRPEDNVYEVQTQRNSSVVRIQLLLRQRRVCKSASFRVFASCQFVRRQKAEDRRAKTKESTED